MKTNEIKIRKWGNKEYRKWQRGEKLTRKEAIAANCYTCNGLEESGVDCLGEKSCPNYQYFPHKGKK